MMIEEEHGGDEHNIRYAVMDTVLVKDLAIFRVGKFLLPMGLFNEYLYAEYVNELPDRPLALWRIAPVAWSEVGAQLRGSYGWSPESSVDYAVYVVNGLLQRDADPDDGVVDDGGDLRKMRNNFRDYAGDDKAFGGRLGLSLFRQIKVGVSAYHGAYTDDDEQRVTIMNADLSFTSGKLVVRSELMKAWQESRNSTLEKLGGYGRVAYRAIPALQPVLQYGYADLADGREYSRVTGGLAYFPFPEKIKRFNFKIAYAYSRSHGHKVSDLENPHEIVFQTVFGF